METTDLVTTDLTGSLTSGDWAAIWPWLAAYLVIILVVGLVTYVYMAWATMVIAKKTNTDKPWLAWIPFANVYLMTQIAKVPWWTFLVIFLTWIPFVGPLAALAAYVWWWWKISEARNRPGWWSILLMIPVVSFVFMGILAWSDKK